MQTPEEFYVAIESAHPSRAVAMIAARDADIRAEAVRWIPVGERLPPLGEYVAAVAYGQVQSVLFRWDGESWYWDEQEEEVDPVSRDEITHWQPLPAPPAAERSDADGSR
jgi:hypothetical protein